MVKIKVNTKKLDINIDEKGGDINIEYSIDLNDKPCGNNTLKINVREA